jgi:hypothetical protein
MDLARLKPARSEETLTNSAHGTGMCRVLIFARMADHQL